jgi:DNA-binding NarL/FixJ family response regulator
VPDGSSIDPHVPEDRADLHLLQDVAAMWLEALAGVAAETGQIAQARRLIEAVQLLRASPATDEASAPRLGWERPLGIGQTVPRAQPVRTRPRPPLTLLTRRELEVAALIAQGLTNRDIAQELVISERTADTHVGNILSKLRLTSRAQIAAWVVDHGLAAR